MLKPFLFQNQLKDYFKKQDKTWEWFSKQLFSDNQIESLKTEILKNAYRLDSNSEVEIYEILNYAKNKLGIVIPITIYQSQNAELNNGSIYIFKTEAHIVLSGSVLKLLDKKELLALFGHELSHIQFYTLENGEFEVTNRIIEAIANDHSSQLYYFETARLFQLYLELFCDYGALQVTDDLEAVISTLIKLNTGLEKVSVESYLKQVDEILARIELGSAGITHPEIYIRAKSLQLLHQDADGNRDRIEKIVNGSLDLERLNIFSKQEVYDLTKIISDLILKPKWLQSDLLIVLYKQYFRTFNPKVNVLIDEVLKDKILNSKENLKRYFAYVFVDFAMADRELTEPAIGQFLDITEQLRIDSYFKDAIKKEMKFTEKPFKDYLKKCTSALNQILESDTESTY